jgi:hypothetical protein
MRIADEEENIDMLFYSPSPLALRVIQPVFFFHRKKKPTEK